MFQFHMIRPAGGSGSTLLDQLIGAQCRHLYCLALFFLNTVVILLNCYSLVLHIIKGVVVVKQVTVRRSLGNIFILCAIVFSVPKKAIGGQGVEFCNPFKLQFSNNETVPVDTGHNAVVSIGPGGHKIKDGGAGGLHISGVIPAYNTDFGAYVRGELLVDEYKTGRFWSWNMAVGGGYFAFKNVIPFITVGKCFSNYSTCYFNMRHPTANDDDIDAIYYGIGGYFTNPLFNGMIEVALDWSPYKKYNGRSIYIGYGFIF